MKIIFILFLYLFLNLNVLAEIRDFGSDFSSRSKILNQINSKPSITQEQRDLLKNKKLYLNTKCLIEQIEKNNLQNILILLDSNLNPNEDYYNEVPLYTACKKNRTEIAKLLLDYGAKPDRTFESELYEALKNKNRKLALMLIEQGANVNYSTPITEKSVLYISLKNKMYDISKILIEKGAKPDVRVFKYIKKHKLEYIIPNENSMF